MQPCSTSPCSSHGSYSSTLTSRIRILPGRLLLLLLLLPLLLLPELC
jgi:hypothetical protein